MKGLYWLVLGKPWLKSAVDLGFHISHASFSLTQLSQMVPTSICRDSYLASICLPKATFFLQQIPFSYDVMRQKRTAARSGMHVLTFLSHSVAA